MKAITENAFRDEFVLQTVKKYTQPSTVQLQPSTVQLQPSVSLAEFPSPTSFRIQHGSRPFGDFPSSRCILCRQKTVRRCPDCPNAPHLCQTSTKDCHSLFHSISYDNKRKQILSRKRSTPISTTTQADKKKGRPTGSKKKTWKKGFSSTI